MTSLRMFLVALAIGMCASTAREALAQCSLGPVDGCNSYFVPQVGSVSSPFEGNDAIKFFRMCPNNDGGASLPNSARIKIVLRDINNNPIPNMAAADIALI